MANRQYELSIGFSARRTQQAINSSLTAVDLHGLTKLELEFAILMVAGATGLILALGLAERRRIFAILTALGASSSQLGAFLWSEGLFILSTGGAIGTGLGFGISGILVKMLKGVFDPPPQGLVIPWTYLVVLTLAASISTILAVIGTRVVSRRREIESLRSLNNY